MEDAFIMITAFAAVLFLILKKKNNLNKKKKGCGDGNCDC
mgnify:FL=1|tara:strand:- start:161675 stop:161794 length:120 start_codon:yes stop_codon:yes gene_type:complete